MGGALVCQVQGPWPDQAAALARDKLDDADQIVALVYQELQMTGVWPDGRWTRSSGPGPAPGEVTGPSLAAAARQAGSSVVWSPTTIQTRLFGRATRSP